MIAAGSPRSNLATLDALLEAGAEPLRTATGGVTAAWYAAGGGTRYPLTPKHLSELGPDHPFRNWGGGDAARLERLLDLGADPNERAGNGRSMLGEACGVGDPKRVELLIRRGAQVSRVAPYEVPLFLAAEAGSVDCVRLLLGAGVPANLVHESDNALQHASTPAVMEILWESGVRPVDGAWGRDPLDVAFEEERFETAAFLLGKLPRGSERQDYLDHKLVMCSGTWMNPEAVRMLLKEGANPRRSMPNYGSALHSACWQGDGNMGRETETVRQTLKLLIEAGADVNLRDESGGTPLYEAALGDWGAPTSIEVLLAAGAEVDPIDCQGHTPLSLAASRGEVACVRLLLAAGADASIARAEAMAHVKSWRSIVARHRRAGDLEPRHEEALAEAEEAARLLGAD